MLPKKENYLRDECYNVLSMVGMQEHMDDSARFLSYGVLSPRLTGLHSLIRTKKHIWQFFSEIFTDDISCFVQ